MKPALYAISYQDTGFIMSYCQLEQRDLSVTGAVDVLLDQLVGTQLTVSLHKPTTNPFTIVKSHLKVDEVDDDANFAAFVLDPHKFVLDLSDSAAKPGDGKKKTLTTTTVTPTFKLDATADVFRVTVTNDLASGTALFAILDGHEIPITVSVPGKIFEFPFATSVGSVHSVVFASRGLTPFFGFMKAT